MIINGQQINNDQELENCISGMSEEVKISLRGVFHSIVPELTTSQKDYVKYQRRANIKDILVAQIATENMDRVRAGIWTVPDLIALTEDQGLRGVLNDLSTLSFELAVAKVTALSNPLITQDIKNGWILKLQNHFY